MLYNIKYIDNYLINYTISEDFRLVDFLSFINNVKFNNRNAKSFGNNLTKEMFYHIFYCINFFKLINILVSPVRKLKSNL